MAEALTQQELESRLWAAANSEALDEAYAELAAEEELDEEEAGYVARRASRAGAFMRTPDRV